MEPDHNAAVEDLDKDTVVEDLEDIAVEDSLAMDILDRILAVVGDNLLEDILAVDIQPEDILP